MLCITTELPFTEFHINAIGQWILALASSTRHNASGIHSQCCIYPVCCFLKISNVSFWDTETNAFVRNNNEISHILYSISPWKHCPKLQHNLTTSTSTPILVRDRAFPSPQRPPVLLYPSHPCNCHRTQQLPSWAFIPENGNMFTDSHCNFIHCSQKLETAQMSISGRMAAQTRVHHTMKHDTTKHNSVVKRNTTCMNLQRTE